MLNMYFMLGFCHGLACEAPQTFILLLVVVGRPRLYYTRTSLGILER